MKKQKSEYEPLHFAIYVNKSDIARLLRVSRKTAERVYRLAEIKDTNEFGDYRPTDTQVRLTSALASAGVSYEQLVKRYDEERKNDGHK